jgi:hypothetical protein
MTAQQQLREQAPPLLPKRTGITYLLDPLERAASTFAQQFVNVLLAGGAGGLLVSQNWSVAVDTAGFAAIISVLLSVTTFKVPNQPAQVDLMLRVARTYVASFVGTVTASHATHSVVHADWKAAAAIAVPVAFTAGLKGLAALSLRNTIGASLIPKTWMPEAE